MKNKMLLAHLALFAVGIIYGLNYVIAKDVMVEGYLHPFNFILLRVFTATILLWATNLIFFRQKVARKHIPYLALCAVFGVAINQLLFFSGLKLSSPINASLIMTTNPILVLIGAHWILHEKLTSRKSIGIAIGMVGAVWLISRNRLGSSGLELSFWGDLMIFINATAYGVYLILVKRMMKLYHPIAVVKWVFTFGLIYVLPFGLLKWDTARWSDFDLQVWLSVGYVLVFTTYFAYVLNAMALKSVSPTTVAVYIYLQPIVATIATISLGRESLGFVQITCGFLIFTGIYLVSFSGKFRS